MSKFLKFLQKNNLTQREVADALKVHHMTVYYWTRGRIPRGLLANKIVEFFSKQHKKEYTFRDLF